MATLEENINQAISDFDDIKSAIEECGVEVPNGTDTKEYGDLIRSGNITLTDTATGTKYKLFVENSKLTLEKKEV